MPGAFKLEYLHPFKPIFICKIFSLPHLGHSNLTICIPLSHWEISICFTFILEGRFLLPQRTNRGESEFTQLMDETSEFGCLGHSNWTICIPLNPFYSGQVQCFSPLYWKANSYYPRGLTVGKRNSPNSRNG